ncbi:cupin domain-containing protein [Cupriavidus basilensis]
MDPLSEVLSLLSTQKLIFFRPEGGRCVGHRLSCAERHQVLNAVVKGRCWLAVEGEDQPIQLDAGDCFLLSSQAGVLTWQRFRVASREV